MISGGFGASGVSGLTVLARFNPEGIHLAQEFLCRGEGAAGADGADVWCMGTEKAAAHRFESHYLAHAARAEHAYDAKWDPDRKHLPWALVLGRDETTRSGGPRRNGDKRVVRS